MTLTNAEIAAMRKRAEVASPGPWDFSLVNNQAAYRKTGQDAWDA